MLNLLRMDLYRIRKSKSVYVCFGILLLMTIAIFYMLWLMETPKGNQVAVSLGMLTEQQVQQEDRKVVMQGMDTQIMFRQMGLDGGGYTCIFGVWLMLFICMDYQSGFIKNILASHQNRRSYVAGKIAAAAIVNLIYLLLHFTVVEIGNQMSGIRVPHARIGDILFYFGWAWVVTTAFAALIIFICIFTRSVAAGALAVALFSTGWIVMPLYFLLSMFHAGGWMKYTIYRMLSEGPGSYTSVNDLYVYAVGVIFVAIYAALSDLVLKKQDI